MLNPPGLSGEPRNARAVNETYTLASAKAKQLEEQHHLNRDSGLEFNKAVI